MTRPTSGRRRRPVLGLDIGGTKLAAGVVTADGEVRSFLQVPTPRGDGWLPGVEALLRLGDEALLQAALQPREIGAVGVGCGGPLDAASGTINTPPNLPGWDLVPIVQLVQDHFGRSTHLENDASAAALATYLWGRWSGTQHLVYLTISSGIGSGVIIDGQLFRGAADNGGEIGHSLVDWRGRACGCGQQGCAEAYVSGNSIGRRAQEALAAGRRSSLELLGASVTAADVSAAALAGDLLAGQLWHETTAILGRVVATVLNIFEPNLVVLGGGVTQAGAMLIEPVRAAALSQAMPPAAEAGDVVLSAHGVVIGVLGAAAVALTRTGQSFRRSDIRPVPSLEVSG